MMTLHDPKNELEFGSTGDRAVQNNSHKRFDLSIHGTIFTHDVNS